MTLKHKTTKEIRAHIAALQATRRRYERNHAGGGDPAAAGWREIERNIKNAYQALVKAEMQELPIARVGAIDSPWEMQNRIDALQELRAIYDKAKPPYFESAIGEIDRELTQCYRRLARMEVSENG